MLSIKGQSGSWVSVVRANGGTGLPVWVSVCLVFALVGCQEEVVVQLPAPPRADHSVRDQLFEIEHRMARLRLAEQQEKLLQMADDFEGIDTACDRLRGKSRFSGPDRRAYGGLKGELFDRLQAKLAVIERHAELCRELAIQQHELSLRKRWAMLGEAYGELSAMLTALQEDHAL